MCADVAAYVASCPTCQRVKDSTQKQQGPLQPLAPPTERFSSYSMDFIFGLPRAKGRDGVWRDGVMTVVDRATKRKTLVALHEGITAVEATDLFLLWVVRPFGVPQEIISDRDPRFMSLFWQQVFARLGTRLLHSTAHHPQTDGESERAHRVIEQVLRLYVLGCPPEKWVDLLLFCEMSLNGHLQSSTQQTPDALTYG